MTIAMTIMGTTISVRTATHAFGNAVGVILKYINELPSII
eukprot:CAMPEP_0181067972 /NCGR_PEP_ID=MMETSP1070-20121207/26165_1 /TAXON_ID=265543 /ORGANISM="Minutocellus polymorphus, Strain NH13" /LENGTH=39 /DNA_ID= /DNA_START= /DNA_END= /DNA_ORIENTATION=